MSSKNGCSNASLIEILLLGSYTSIFSNKLIPSFESWGTTWDQKLNKTNLWKSVMIFKLNTNYRG